MNKETLLREFILSKFKSLKDFSRQIGLPPTTVEGILVRGLETAKTKTLIEICKYLSIDIYSLLEGKIKDYISDSFKLTLKEKKLIEDYRTLDSFGVGTVDSVLQMEKERNDFYANEIKFVWKPLTDSRASAGTGEELSDYMEFVKVPRTEISEYCDYVVKVFGNSMEPEYFSGEYVLVKAQPDINVGQVGVYILNGEGYIKQKGNNELISLNKDYNSIKINDYDEIKCCGLVLGKTEVIE